ncbi:MAG: response regulator transcription factor [Chloroflexota bacterium]
MKALIVEDNADVVEAVSLCLQLRWPDIDIAVAEVGVQGVEIARARPLDIVILDINLPDIDGFEVLRRVRTFSTVPTIILTVRGKEEDQARGLEMGADDYIVKPFRPRDFIARVTAVLRRSTKPPESTTEPSIARGTLEFNLRTNEARLKNDIVRLTPTEGRLLYALMRSPEETISNQRLLQEVWGREDVTADTLRTRIRRLRDKLNDNPNRIILTERGEGYRFVSPA